MKIIECPRDAMQGIEKFIPTAKKVAYINQLLEVGFDTIDFGSFVSPKAIPQMRDTADVVAGLSWRASRSKLLAIVANERGAESACTFEAIHYLGFPLSISETFQQRNTNKSIAEALTTLETIIRLSHQSGKKVVTYISMGFGNPYGDPYDEETVLQFAGILMTMGTDVISLADTVGAAEPVQIARLFTKVTSQYPDFEIGVHLHAAPHGALGKIESAYQSGCRRFDGALMGYGGCPMAKDEMVGNIATEMIMDYLKMQQENTGIDEEALEKSIALAREIFVNG